MPTAFIDLFEDEISDVLRPTGHDAVIERGPFSWRAALRSCPPFAFLDVLRTLILL